MRLLSVIALTLSVMYSHNSAAIIQLKLSHSSDRSHPVHKAMELMAKQVKEKSKGEVRIRVYPDGVLGNQRESVELLQTGALDLAKSNANELEVFYSPYGAFNMPYLFRDKAHYHKVLSGKTAQDILKGSTDKGFVGLTFYDAGSRNFYSKKPIHQLSDLKGLKVRVQPGRTAIDMVEKMGGAPTPVYLGEIYAAMQQGVVDAAENNMTTFVLHRHNEVATHFTWSEHTMVPDVLLVSTKIWNKLSKDQQVMLQQAAAESSEAMKDLWQEAEDRNTTKAEKMGVKIIRPDKKPFIQSVEPMYTKLKKEKPELYALVEEMRDRN